MVKNWHGVISNRFIKLIKSALAAKDYKTTQTYLGSAINIDPDNPELLELARELKEQSPSHSVYTKNSHLVPEMIYVHSGNFTMGGVLDNAKPARRVKVKAFKMSQAEISFKDFLPYARAKRIRLNSSAWGTGKRPVININWNRAVDYTKWLSKKTGRKFRLPSEAEWEYAAHKSQTLIKRHKINKYSMCLYGNGADRSSGIPWRNFKCKDGFSGTTAPVKSFKPNSLGFYDMHGNVWEWTLDCWHKNYKGAPATSEAWIKDGDCKRKVIKGGGWNSSTTAMLPAYRHGAKRKIEFNYIGFRIVEEL
jgi:formylglycine-generating enzyme required for sulfatase activity